MKRIKLLPFIILLILLTTSCNGNAIEDQEEPDYSYFQSSNKTGANNLLENVPLLEGSNNDKSSIKKTKKEWPYELDFDGVTSNKSYNIGNLNTNSKFTCIFSALVCPDYKNDCIYYVNYGKDNYIYRLDDRGSTLLIEKEAHSLQLWDNKLYFIEISESGFLNSGDIYCLNLEEESLRLVQQVDSFYLYISTYGIFYRNYKNNDGYVNNYYLDFGSSEPKKVEHSFLASYNEFQLLHTYEDGFYLYNSDTKEKTYLAPAEYMNNKPMLHNEYFMFIKDSCVYTLNLLNGEKKIYDLYNYDSLFDYELFISDYCIIDKLIYATDGIRLYIINMDNGNIEEYTGEYSIDYSYSEFENGLLLHNFSIYNLFTDGSKVYGLIRIRGEKSEELVELILKENPDTERKDMYPLIVEKKELNQ